ncbi:MAG: CDP-alcohol phosphatidyltransferase family protein [Planctomycetota bacterium]
MTFGPTHPVVHRRFGCSAADVITYTYMGIGLLVVAMNIGAVIWAWWLINGPPYQTVPSVNDSLLTRILFIPTTTDMLQKRAGLSLLLVMLAGLLDGIDGPIARWRGTAAPRGEDLDGMADTVAFGMAPAATLWATAAIAQLQQMRTLEHAGQPLSDMPLLGWFPFIWMGCGLFVGAMQWRLRASHHTGWTHFVFKGLPAPGAGLILGTFAVLWDNALRVSAHRVAAAAGPLSMQALAGPSNIYVVAGLCLPVALAIYMTTPIPAVKMNRAGRFQFTLDLLILAAFSAVLYLQRDLILAFTAALGTYIVVGLLFGIQLLRIHGRRQRAEAAAMAAARAAVEAQDAGHPPAG